MSALLLLPVPRGNPAPYRAPVDRLYLVIDNVQKKIREMAGFYFVPGTWGGVALRVAQCVFAAASAYTMVTALRATSYTSTFNVLVGVMFLQAVWSFLQTYFYVHCAWAKKELEQPIKTFLVTLVDAFIALLSFGAASASAFVVLLFVRDTGLCSAAPELPCGRYQLAVSLAYVAWLLQATTAFALFYLLVKVVTGAQHAD